MSREIFISYSRRDQEFVTRLASDLNAQVAGVWFDQSTLQLGQRWHDEIMDGIRECTAFLLVLSPDAMESRYVRAELNKALELGKTIFPVVSRPAKWREEFETLVKDVQTLDLRSGSYTDNFRKLVDGLIEAEAGRATGERPFLREPIRRGLSVVFSKIPGWAFAWSMGWLVFWVEVLVFLIFLAASRDGLESNEILGFALMLISGGIGGFVGGLLAGFSRCWRCAQMHPASRGNICLQSFESGVLAGGPLGMIISGLITWLMVTAGARRMCGCDHRERDRRSHRLIDSDGHRVCASRHCSVVPDRDAGGLAGCPPRSQAGAGDH